MKIVIVGDGKVGSTLASQLAGEGHDVTIIDNNAETLRHSVETLDVKGIVGNGATYAVQVEAEVPSSDLVVAATSSDELNVLVCMLGKRLGAHHTIARIRDPEYLDTLIYLRKDLGLSLEVNPEHATAREIARLIGFPSAITIGSLAKGRVDLIEIRVAEGSPFDGKQLKQLKNSDYNVLVCAVERGEEFYIPSGEFTLQKDDKLHITGANSALGAFLRANGSNMKRVRRVIIVGGGRIAFYLGKVLSERGLQVKIIEKNPQRCRALCEALPGVMVIQGDGTEQEILLSEDIRSTDAFVALTNVDEENLIVSMFAMDCGVSKVITKINRLNYMQIMERMGIDCCVSPKIITANQIVRYVRAMENSKDVSSINALYRLANGKAEALEFEATADTRNLGVPLKDVDLKQKILLAAIVRRGRIIIPRGNDCILKGDAVIVVSADIRLTELNDIFD